MKKVLLITQLFPPHPGGAQNYAYLLCSNMPQKSIAVLADDAHIREYKHLMPEYKFSVYYRPFFLKSSLIWPKWLRLFGYLPEIVAKEKPKILWAGEPLPTGVAVMMFSKVCGIPYFVTSHGADVLNPQKRGRWKTWLLKKVLHNAEFVTTNSEYTRLIVSRLGVSHEKSIVVYPCPNLSPPLASRGIKEGTQTIEYINNIKNNGCKILLTVCRQELRKGVDKVLEALPYVWKEYPDIVYVVVGEGEASEKLKMQSESLKRKNTLRQAQGDNTVVIFTGAVSGSILKEVYSVSDVFIMAPREMNGLIEGFGIVYLEASSFSLPVIGSKVGGVPEAVVDLYDQNYDTATGLLVNDPCDTKDIAKKILILLKDEGLARKLGENGKTHSKKFEWKKETEKIVNRVFFCK